MWKMAKGIFVCDNEREFLSDNSPPRERDKGKDAANELCLALYLFVCTSKVETKRHNTPMLAKTARHNRPQQKQ